MEIIVKGSSEEIAAFALAIQKQHTQENKIVRSEGFNLDNEIPNAPTIHSDTATGSVISESLEFTLSGSTSPSGIARYQYSLDNGIRWNNADPTGKEVKEKCIYLFSIDEEVSI